MVAATQTPAAPAPAATDSISERSGTTSDLSISGSKMLEQNLEKTTVGRRELIEFTIDPKQDDARSDKFYCLIKVKNNTAYDYAIMAIDARRTDNAVTDVAVATMNESLENERTELIKDAAALILAIKRRLYKLIESASINKPPTNNVNDLPKTKEIDDRGPNKLTSDTIKRFLTRDKKDDPRDDFIILQIRTADDLQYFLSRIDKIAVPIVDTGSNEAKEQLNAINRDRYDLEDVQRRLKLVEGKLSRREQARILFRGEEYTTMAVITEKRGKFSPQPARLVFDCYLAREGEDVIKTAEQVVYIAPSPLFLTFIAVQFSIVGVLLLDFQKLIDGEEKFQFFNQSSIVTFPSAILIALVFYNIYDYTEIGKSIK